MDDPLYPDAVDPELVGTYPASAHAGGGYVWDQVLEYRVWFHPERGTGGDADGNGDYYCPFATYSEAVACFRSGEGAQEPVVLIRQDEYIDEPNPGDYRHVTGQRITEWVVEHLRRPRRTQNTIPGLPFPQRSREPARDPEGTARRRIAPR